MSNNSTLSEPGNWRVECATSLCMALGAAHQDDAAAICLAFLDGLTTGGPHHDPFGLVFGDALLWADSAPLHEVMAYGVAALDHMRQAALGLNTRKKLFVKLWESFAISDRAAFLAKVDGDGRFHGRAA